MRDDPKPLLEIRDLVLEATSYPPGEPPKTVTLVHGISVSVEKGKVLGLIGGFVGRKTLRDNLRELRLIGELVATMRGARQMVAHEIHRDPVQPGRQLGLAFVGFEGTHSLQKSLLRHVVCFIAITDVLDDEAVQAGTVALHKIAKQRFAIFRDLSHDGRLCGNHDNTLLEHAPRGTSQADGRRRAPADIHGMPEAKAIIRVLRAFAIRQLLSRRLAANRAKQSVFRIVSKACCFVIHLFWVICTKFFTLRKNLRFLHSRKR